MSTTSATAGHRRRAYQCLKCLHLNDKEYIEARYRVHNHYLKEHVSLDSVPYYCRVCMFRSFTEEDLNKHVTGYPRHKLILEETKRADSPDFLVTSTHPYRITEKDVVALSAEESSKHWDRTARRKDLVAEAVREVFPDGLGGCLVSPSPSVTSLQTTPVMTPARPLTVNSVSQNLTALNTIQPVIDISALQQLLNVLGATQPTNMQLPNPSPIPPASYVAPAVTTDGAAQLDNASAALPTGPPPIKASASVDSVGGDVLDNIPTREECRRISKASAPSSSCSSGSSSSGSSVSKTLAEYQKILQAITSLQESVYRLQDSFTQQQQCTDNMTRCMLNLAGMFAKPTPAKEAPTTSHQPTPPRPAETEQPATPRLLQVSPVMPPTQPPTFLPHPFPRAATRAEHQPRRHRDRSPLRERPRQHHRDRRDSRERREDKENKPYRRDQRREDRGCGYPRRR